jgi:hypothetical protein
MSPNPEALDILARLLDGFDDEAAAEARQLASDMRAGLITGPLTLGMATEFS